MKKIAVILAGAGVFDGSELHEAVLTLYFLETKGGAYKCFAPDKDQMHVINHAKGEPDENDTRNVLVEAARISRGPIQPLSELKAEHFDALVIPGGFGAAKNLCDFAVKGAECDVDPEVRRIIEEFNDVNKPIAPMCIAPAAVARVLGGKGKKVRLTIGTDPETAAAIEAMGAEHVNCNVDEIAVDENHKVVSTPAFMLGPGVSDVAQGIEKLAQQVIDWC